MNGLFDDSHRPGGARVFCGRRGIAFYLAVVLCLSYGSASFANDARGHLDPDLLSGWLTWLHLTIQWVHLAAFATWVGLSAGTLTFGLTPHLDWLLYSSWILLLILLGTGTYNMEWSAGIPETPSLLMLPSLVKIPYGVSYTVALAIKIGLYGLAVLLTLVITALHVTRRVDESRLRKAFLMCGAFIGILLTLAASVVLFYHEVADLWPTNAHSLGGVLGHEGARDPTKVGFDTSPPNDFRLLSTPEAWIDIGLRWLHLLGFGLWAGSSVWITVFPGASAARFIGWSWLFFLIQIASGIGNMERWTPFSVAPYPWNLHELSHLRFGSSYTIWMAAKHALVLAALAVLATGTFRFLKNRRFGKAPPLRLRPYAALTALVGFSIGYVMMALLLLHEGVDHAL